jgi:hypothetical protein
MPKHKRSIAVVNDQFEDEVMMRSDLRNMMYYHNSSGQEHLRFICPKKLIDIFWKKYHINRISAFKNYDEEVFTKIKEGYLRVLSIVIFTEWPDLILFNPVFVQEGLDDDSLFFNEHQLKGMVKGIDNFVAQQYLFKPEIIKHTKQAQIQIVPPTRRLPFIGESELLGLGAFGTVRKKRIAPHCLESISEDSVSINNSDVSYAGHHGTQY